MNVLERWAERFHSTALEDQVWFHGLRALEDIRDFLKEPGDFLVWCSQSNEETKIVLSVFVGGGATALSNLVITTSEGSKKGWVLRRLKSVPGRPQFDNIVQLIEYYKIHTLPGKVRLKRGVPRPEWLIKHSNVTFLKKDLLGCGHFCNVYRGRFKSRHVAIKMSNDAPDQDETEVINGRASMLREARIMSSFSHANIIKFYGVACDHLPILLVMEFCPGGSLESHLLKTFEIGTLERLLYCLEAARGMRYLHHNGCIHKDLATRNCLLSDRGVIKIADFGLSEIVYTIRQGDIGPIRLPLRWCAPELLDPGKRMPYSTHSDVWAFGVLIYEVFNNGEEPWPNDHAFKGIAKRIRDIQMPAMPKATPPFVVQLVKGKIWVKKPDARPSMAAIVEILARHLCSNAVQFPPSAQMAVNRIPGVKRDNFLQDDLDTILRAASVEILPMTSMVSRKPSDANLVTARPAGSIERTTSSKKPAKPSRTSHKPSRKSTAETTTKTVITSLDTTVDTRQSVCAPAPSTMTSNEAKKTTSIETMAKRPT